MEHRVWGLEFRVRSKMMLLGLIPLLRVFFGGGGGGSFGVFNLK